MSFLVIAHSVWRWVVLVAALAAIFGAARARSQAGGAPPKTGSLYTISFDIQVLLGLIIWLIGARWNTEFFFAWLHPIVMLVALGIAHVGRGREKKAGGNSGLWAYVVSFVLVLLAIPSYSWVLH